MMQLATRQGTKAATIEILERVAHCLEEYKSEYGIYPEVGDVVLWQDNYYEVDDILENQYFLGKDPDYSYSTNNDDFGSSISIIVNAHYARDDKLGI
jgi:hypothetical protein